MSIEAIAFVKSRDLGAAESAQARLLLYVIAENTFNDSHVCVLGLEQLAYEAGRVSERTIRRHIDDLVEARLLIRKARYPEAGGRLTDAIRIVGFKRWYLAHHKGRKRPLQPVKHAAGLVDNLSGRGGGLPDKLSARASGQQVSTVTGQQVSGTDKDSRTSPVTEESPPPPQGAGEGEGKSIFDGFGEPIRTFLARVWAVVRIDHANPPALAAEIAAALKGEGERVLDALAAEVIRGRKKIVSPKCVLDLLAKAQSAVPLLTVKAGDPSFAAWCAHYASQPGMVSLGRAQGFKVRETWPGGFASRAAPAAPGAPAGVDSPRPAASGPSASPGSLPPAAANSGGSHDRDR